MSLPELVFVSNLFPDARDPYRGRPNAIILHGLRGEFGIRVVSPRPSLSRARFDIRPGDEPLEPAHFTVPYVPKFGSAFNHRLMAWRLGDWLDRLHRERPIDVLLSSWLFPDGCAAAMWARRSGVPLVMITQGTDTHHYLKYPLRRRAILAAAAQAERIVCRSRDLARLLQEAGVPATRLTTIYNGVDPALFRRRPQGEARAELGLPPEARCVLFVGNLVEVKNPLLLVEAFAQAAGRIAEPSLLLMAGKGHLKDRILAMAAGLGVGDRVRLLGPLPSETISQYMAAADVLALCSRNEGLPNVVLEAMACGLPCLCTDVGGISEVLAAPECGKLVPEGSVRALADGLYNALTTSFQREKIAERGAAYSWNATFRHYSTVLRAAMRPSVGLRPVSGSARSGRRLLFVSNLFPDVRQSYRGQDNARILHRLKEDFEIGVLSPRPALWPRSYRARDEDAALAPRHFVVPYVPRFGSRWNHRLMAWRLVPTMAERHAEKPVDVVLSSWLFPDGCAVARWCRQSGVPLVLITQGTDTHYYLDFPARRKAILEAGKVAHRIICRSRDLATRLEKAGVEKDKLVTIYNGTDRSVFFRRPQAEVRQELGWPQDEKVVLFVGNFLEVKNPMLLVESFGILARETATPLRLVMIGEGPLRRQVQEKVAAIGLREKCTFAGGLKSPAVAQFMNAADVLALTSRNEGLPNVVLEALACGLPVVSTRVGGIDEVIRDAGVGRLCAPDSADAFISTLREGLNEAFDRAAIAAYGEQFSWENTFQGYKNVLLEAMSGEPASPAPA